MKKLFFSSILFLLACLYFSCNNAGTAGGMSDKAKKNLDNARAIAKMFEAGDWSKSGDYIAADAVDHAGMQGDVKGLDAIKANFDNMGKMMGDFKNEVVKEMADDDYVFQWMKETGTAKADMPGMMKAGETKTYNCVEVSKFNADSKVVEHWTFMDMSDMMKMMPQQGNMNPSAPADSSGTKK